MMTESNHSEGKNSSLLAPKPILWLGRRNYGINYPNYIRQLHLLPYLPPNKPLILSFMIIQFLKGNGGTVSIIFASIQESEIVDIQHPTSMTWSLFLGKIPT